MEKCFMAVVDAWRFYKSHFGIANDDDAGWLKAKNDAIAIQKRHGNTKLIMGLMMLMLEQLERDAKNEDVQT